MSQEIADFEFFRDQRMIAVDFSTGRIDTHNYNRWGQERIAYDVGSINQDGYVRIRIGKTLRMKHRYLFWLYHGYLPDEMDHDDKVRNHNSITNLKPATRSTNTTNKAPRKYTQLTDEAVHELCQRVRDGETNITKLAKLYGRSRTQIKAILGKKHWSHISDQYF